jgi:predicted nucleic acid-binding protein
VAPPLLWSEVTSAVNEARWRRELVPEQAEAVLEGFASLGVTRVRPAALYETAGAIARELGWAKTYDAEFLAVARIRRCRAVTGDARMLRGADRTGLVVSVADLPP